ncbi:MAG: hypothetical protein ACT4P6_18830 [Gemmatimonadaceae bacterium]
MTATEQGHTTRSTGGGAIRATQYRALALRAAPRLLGMLDRDPESPTVGSFDRDHWSWKFRDFPIAMLQTGVVPMALLYADAAPDNPYAGAARMLDWTLASIKATLRRQHRNGAFDSVAPFSQDHGVTLQLVLALATALRVLKNEASAALRDAVSDAVRRACAFAARSDEDYAFISNHQGFMALGWHAAGELLGDKELIARGAATVDRIMQHQSPDGWYAEYGGPDPGYESLGISYLATYLAATQHARLADSLKRSVEFYSHCILPDGSVGGAYGSRLTQLYYPAGLELVAAQDPLAARVVEYLGARLPRGNVVTPENVDAHNLPSLLQSYLVAATEAGRPPGKEASAAPLPLPCETDDLWRHFDGSGLTVAATPHCYAVTNARRGGITSVCGRSDEQVLYEDSGVVIDASGAMWCSATPADVDLASASATPRVVQSRVTCGRAGNEQLTPGKFLLLRALGLTVFRSLTLGSFLRRMIISRLITGRERGPCTCERTVRFEDDQITIEDRVTVPSRDGIRGVRLTRGFQPFHMGSARYFHERDLTEIPVVDRTASGGGEWTGPTEWSARSVIRWNETGQSSRE